MNHIFKVVFNPSLGIFVAVPEFAKSRRKSSAATVGSAKSLTFSNKIFSLTALAAGIMLSSSAWAESTLEGTAGNNQQSVAIGYQTTASGDQATALAALHFILESAVHFENSRVGTNQATNTVGAPNRYTPTIAEEAAVEGALSTVFGTRATASGIASVALGAETSATNEGSFAAAAGAKSTGVSSVAIGTAAKASENQAIAIGSNATATGLQSIAIGVGNQVSGNQAGAFGDPSIVAGNASYTFGNDNAVGSTSQNAFVLGHNNQIGATATYNANGKLLPALGLTDTAAVNSSTAIGSNNYINTSSTYVLGSGINTVTNTATGARNPIGDTIANSVYLGDNSTAVAGAAVGTKNLAQDGSVGTTTTAGDKGKVEIATVNGVSYGGFAGATSDGVISVGASGKERRIPNVAAGEISATSTDAINGSQLYMVAKGTLEQMPVVYTNQNGNKVFKQSDGRFTDANGNAYASANIIASMQNANGSTTAPTVLSNVASNLPATYNNDAYNKNNVPVTKSQTLSDDVNVNNAATIGDVLNAGWNLQGNGNAVDFVKAYDTVNFVDGNATTATVKATPDGKVSTVKYDVKVDGSTIKIVDGKLTVATAKNYFHINPENREVNAKDTNNLDAVDSVGNATGAYALAAGYQAQSSGNSSTAVGKESRAIAAYATAFGNKAWSSGNNSTALGSGSRATGGGSLAVGTAAQSSGNSSTAVGRESQATGDYATAFGNDAWSFGNNGTALGSGSRAMKGGSLAVGNSAQSQAFNAAAIGSGASIYKNGSRAVAIGAQANSDHANAVALGSGSATNAAVGTNNATVNRLTYSGFAGESPIATVSVGNDTQKRTITNVAAGRIAADSTDAINGSQLYMTNDVLGNLANSVVKNFGGDAALNPKKQGDIIFTNIGGTGQNNIHDAIKFATTTVKAGKNTTVNKTNAANEYTVNAWDTTVSAKANGGVNITPTINNTNMSRAYELSVNVDNSSIKIVDGKLTVNTDNLPKTKDTVTIVQSEDKSVTVSKQTNDQDGNAVFNIAVAKANVNTDNSGKIINNNTGNTFVTGDNLANALNKAGWNATAGSGVNGGKVSGASSELINFGETLTFDAGKNMALVQNGNRFTYATKDEVEFTKVSTNTIEVPVDGGGKVSINNNGINAGGKTIGGADNGLKDKDGNVVNLNDGNVVKTNVVNVGDLQTVVNNINTDISAAKTEVQAGSNTQVSSTQGANGQTVYTVHADKAVTAAGSGMTVAENTLSDANGTKTTTYTVSANVDGNTIKIDGGKITANTGKVSINTDGSISVNNADKGKLATVDEVSNTLNNAGWNVQGNGVQKDLVNAGDSVNFVNGRGTTVNVESTNGKNTTIKIDSPLAYVNSNLADQSTPSDTVAIQGKGNNPVQISNVASGVRDDVTVSNPAAPSAADKTAIANAINNAGGNTLNNAVNVGDLQAVMQNVNTVVTKNITNQVTNNIVNNIIGTDPILTYDVQGQTEKHNITLKEAINNMNAEGIRFFHTNDGKNYNSGSFINTEDSSAVGSYATAIGVKSSASGSNAIAMGNGAQATGNNSISIGTGNLVSGNNSAAIGDPSVIQGDNSYSIGNNNAINQQSQNVFVMGNNVQIGSGVGTMQTVATMKWDVAAGKYVQETHQIKVYDGDMSNAVALGNATKVEVKDGVALGANSAATRAGMTATATSSAQIGGAVGTVYNGSTVFVTPGASAQARQEVLATAQNTLGAVAVGSETQNRQITGVAAGSRDNDAVNVAQLRSVQSANNNAINYLDQRIGDVNANANAGTAAAMATAGLPQAYLPGKSMIAVGTSLYRGEMGYAVGVSSISDGGNWIIKGTANGNSRGHFGASAAIGYQW